MQCTTLHLSIGTALQRTATHCNALQHTATHCNALQHTATHCNALQHIATHCNTLQHTATHCNTLQHTATHCDTLQRYLVDQGYAFKVVTCLETARGDDLFSMKKVHITYVAVCCSALQCAAVCRSVLLCVAVHCSALQCLSVLQCAAVCCRDVAFSIEKGKDKYGSTPNGKHIVMHCNTL